MRYRKSEEITVTEADRARAVRESQLAVFYRVLARFVAGEQGTKSIKLQMKEPLAMEWAQVRQSIPGVFGYPTEDEAEQAIRRFLGPQPQAPKSTGPKSREPGAHLHWPKETEKEKATRAKAKTARKRTK